MTEDKDPLATGLVMIAARGIAKAMSDALRPHGLAPAQFGILDLIDREGLLYPSTIARKLGIETSTTATTLKRTENHGFISREPDPSDARGVIVTMTSKGRNTLPHARSAVRSVEDRALAGLSDEEQKATREALARVIMNMK